MKRLLIIVVLIFSLSFTPERHRNENTNNEHSKKQTVVLRLLDGDKVIKQEKLK